MDNYILDELNVYKLRALGYTGKNIKIAIIDCGVNSFKDKLGISGGYNFKDKNNDYSDNEGHGTAIASIIKSKEFGIAYNSEIYSLKVELSFDENSIKTIIEAIEWAINNNINIINMSFGFVGITNYKLEDKCREAMNKGIIIVCAAGNNNINQGIGIPASFNSVIAISNLSIDNTLSKTSSFSKGIDFCCYGENLLSYDKNGAITKITGTSYASACACGIIALLIEQNISITFRELYEVIKENTIKIDDVKKSIYYGYGLINAFVMPEVYKKQKELEIYDLSKNIYFDYTKITIELAMHKDSNLKYLPDGESCKINYNITDKNIAVVDGEGFLTGIKEGNTSLVAIMNNSKVAVCDIEVVKKTEADKEAELPSELFNLKDTNIYSMHSLGIKGKGIKIGIIGYGCIDTDLINIKQTINISKDNVKDANGFGTIYTSIIGSKEFGIASEAEIYLVRVAGNRGVVTWENAEKGVNWCIDNKMDIINFSFIDPSISETLLKKCYDNNIICVVNVCDNLAGPVAAQKSEYSLTVSFVTDKKEFISDNSARVPFTGSFVDCVSYGYGIQCINSENKKVIYSEGEAPVAQYYCNIAMMQVMGILALIKQQDSSIKNAVRVRNLLPKLCEVLYGSKNNKTGYGLLKVGLVK